MYSEYKYSDNAHEAVVRWTVMLGEVVGQVVASSSPVDDELALADMIFDPVESHVDGFGAALFDRVVLAMAGVVISYGGGLVRMPHVFESGAEHDAVFAVEK